MAINIISLVLSVLSFVVALCAAIYAKRQALQMRQANRIALYAGQMEIFNAFREVGRSLTGNGADPKPAVIDFYKHVEASKFVFSREPQVHGELQAFWQALDELVELQRRTDPASKQKALSVVDDCEIRESELRLTSWNRCCVKLEMSDGFLREYFLKAETDVVMKSRDLVKPWPPQWIRHCGQSLSQPNHPQSSVSPLDDVVCNGYLSEVWCDARAMIPSG